MSLRARSIRGGSFGGSIQTNRIPLESTIKSPFLSMKKKILKYLKTFKGLIGALVDIDATDPSKSASIVIKEPDRRVRVGNRDGEICDSGAISCVPETRVEAVGSTVSIVNRYARGSKA